MRSGPKIVALLALALLTGAPSANARAPVAVQLLAINDLHGNLEPTTGPDAQINGTPVGGVEYLATHLKAEVARRPGSLIVGAGDLMGGSPPLSGLFAEAPTIAALNALGMSVSSVGNHELDTGEGPLLDKLAGRCQAKAPCEAPRYTYLAANVTHRDGTPILAGTAIRRVAGVRVGFIGEVLKDAAPLISPTAARALVFKDEADTANAAAAKLKAQGVRTIVLLIHQGGEQHPASGQVDPSGCAGMDGEILAVVRRLSPDIGVVVSGHTHKPYNCRIDGRLLTSAGAFGQMYTRIGLEIDPARDTLVSATAINVLNTRDVAKDPAETTVLNRYRPLAAKIADRSVGTVSALLDRKLDGSGASPLGEIVADSMLAGAADKGAQIGLINSGGVRTAVAGPVAGAASRPVTWGELYAVIPFSNGLSILTLTGDQLRRLLEQQFVRPGRPDILQVSHGLAYRFSLAAPTGARVDPASITLNGKPVAPTDRLRIVTTDFLANGGNGFTVFQEGSDPAPGPSDIDALTAYVAAHPDLGPPALDRVKRTDAPQG